MAQTFEDIAARATKRPIWLMTIVLRAVNPSISTTLNLSDRPQVVGSSQYAGIVATWDEFYTGLARLSGSTYNQNDLRITLAVDHTLDQDVDHVITDVLNAYHLTGAVVTVYKSFADLGTATADTEKEQRFVGIIDKVSEISRNRIVCQARSENATKVTPAAQVHRATYPDVLDQERGDRAPIIAGEVGYSHRDWSVRNADADVLTFNSDWKFLCVNECAAPARLQDVITPTLRVNSLDVDDQQSINGYAGPFIVFDHWNDRGNSLVQLATGDYTEGSGTVDIPLTDGTEAAQITDDMVLLRRLDVPHPDPSLVTATTLTAWTDWENAFSRDLDTYATITNDSTALRTDGNDFLTWEQGTGPGVVYDDGDGHLAYLIALVWTSASMTVRLAVDWTGVAGAPPQILDINNVSGPTIIKAQLTGTAFEEVIQFGWGPDSPDDSMWINMTSPSSGDELRVYLFGIAHELHPRQFTLRQRSSPVTVGGFENSRPPKFFFSGFAGAGIGTGFNMQFGNVLKNLIIDATADLDDPIESGDLQAGASTFGSWALLDTELDASIDENETGSSIFRASIIETDDIDLATIMSRATDAAFIHIWRSTRDGMYKTRMKKVDPDANGLTLLKSDVSQGSFKASYTLLTELYNAIYVEFAWDELTGKYTQEVRIDNTTIDSSDARGNNDANRAGSFNLGLEASADASQNLYGRRVQRIRTKYIRSPGAAWDMCVRRFNLLKDQRVQIEFQVDGWGTAIEPCYVFTTDATLDDIMRYPGFVSAGSESEPSWSGRKWWVIEVREKAYGLTTITAVNVDS